LLLLLIFRSTLLPLALLEPRENVRVDGDHVGKQVRVARLRAAVADHRVSHVTTSKASAAAAIATVPVTTMMSASVMETSKDPTRREHRKPDKPLPTRQCRLLPYGRLASDGDCWHRRQPKNPTAERHIEAFLSKAPDGRGRLQLAEGPLSYLRASQRISGPLPFLTARCSRAFVRGTRRQNLESATDAIALPQ
jgi:hypothetical protein